MTKRRSFIKSATVLGAATLLHQTSWGHEPQPPTTSKIKPKKLKLGNTIGVVAPGFAVKPEALYLTLETLEKMGFNTYHTERIKGNYGYFSNTDKERAADLNEMFANPEIDAILCARGGYGCTRILDLLDYEAIQNNPKILIGFSDITALINTIYDKTGLVCFHGPVGTTLDDEYSKSYFKKVLMEPMENLPIKNAILKDPRQYRNSEYYRYTITKGVGQGELAGGSLSLVTAMIGTPYEIDFTDKLVFLEDVEEAPYRMDRMLTQLTQVDTLSKAKGIIFGVCKGCDRKRTTENFTLREVILDRIAPLGMPAVYGMSFGHIPQNSTLPIGIEATLNAYKKQLRLEETAVR
ncbi:LD-carboxypeptidase [Allomuricauda sp. F6463D]|uniref:S66 peptidase family protein n=1 Tax=Allomuricauda sp. F6463D TaxID=2926409 RepID=UPI001FF287BE|nr:LD-carboxypeptidase [Muricauda sp. F6463D]MCK0161973.1 LD-carboxypeptidase [Muricauda sp. F6463D]